MLAFPQGSSFVSPLTAPRLPGLSQPTPPYQLLSPHLHDFLSRHPSPEQQTFISCCHLDTSKWKSAYTWNLACPRQELTISFFQTSTHAKTHHASVNFSDLEVSLSFSFCHHKFHNSQNLLDSFPTLSSLNHRVEAWPSLISSSPLFPPIGHCPHSARKMKQKTPPTHPHLSLLFISLLCWTWYLQSISEFLRMTSQTLQQSSTSVFPQPHLWYTKLFMPEYTRCILSSPPVPAFYMLFFCLGWPSSLFIFRLPLQGSAQTALLNSASLTTLIFPRSQATQPLVLHSTVHSAVWSLYRL